MSKKSLFRCLSLGQVPKYSFSSFRRLFLGSFYFLQLKRRCSGNCFLSLHHQYFADSSALILWRWVPTIACPNLSCRYLATKLLLPLRINGLRGLSLYFFQILFLVYSRDIKSTLLVYFTASFAAWSASQFFLIFFLIYLQLCA